MARCVAIRATFALVVQRALSLDCTPKVCAATRRELLASAASAPAFFSAAAVASTDAVRLASVQGVSHAKFELEAATAAKATAKAVYAYDRDGVAVVRSVVSDYWLEALRRGCEEAQDEAGPYAQCLNAPADAGLFFTDLEMARRLDTFAAFALHGPCAAVAGTVTRSSAVRYLYDQLFIKEAGVSVPTPWHQDGGYWRVQGNDLCSVFVPLDRVRPKDCLTFVPGTQDWPLHNPAHFADGTPYHGTGLPELTEAQLARVSRRLTFYLDPGDVLVFSSKTVHGGTGNWGRALSTRWAGDDVRFWARPGEGAVPTGDIDLQDGDDLKLEPSAFPEVWHYL